jgi:adenylate cyclase
MSKILVVDDSREMRDGLAKLLRRTGYTVSTAESGKSAWTTLYTGLPDLIILDLMMREVGGVTFLRMLRSHHHWNHLPVLVITGLDNDESLVQEARSLGVIDVIRKGGGNVDQLIDCIANAAPLNPEVTATKR